jgi:S1-C subfamily serine protease
MDGAMQKKYRFYFHLVYLFVIFICFAGTGCQGLVKKSGPASPAAIENSTDSVVRINVTRQGYNFHRPWQQVTTTTQTAIGVVIEGPRVLVTASLLANHRYIEIVKVDSGEKSGAEVMIVDYEANLALIKPSDPEFLEGMRPLRLASGIGQGDELTVWQIKPNGTVIPGQAAITAVELTRYSYRNHFLVYRLNGSLQYRFRNITLPVVRNSHLAGLVKHYDANGQTIDVIPAPVIDHFLKDADNGDYAGFPKAGILIASTEDPQLRGYLNMPDGMDGVYVEGVVPGSAAGKAGILEGDVIVSIAGYPVDRRGNYTHPRFDKVALSHLIRCEFQVGEKITYQVFRSGKTLAIDVTARHPSPQSFLVPPFIIDQSPNYFILGGLVFQELSASYLREYGNNWAMKAPIHLVYYERNQEFFDPGEREKIVLLTSILPSSYTIGYEQLSDLIVSRVNDRPIRRLEDLPEALKYPVDGFHKIEFEQNPKFIYLDPAELPLIDKQIRDRYHLQQLHNIQ